MTPPWARIPQPEAAPAETRSYDLVKEFVIALVAVLVLTLAGAAVFGAPDDKPVTLAAWAKADPNDFTATALSELDGSSDTAGYGAPYNTAAPGQKIGPVGLQKAAGVRHPVDTAKDFVLAPLANAPQTPDVAAALAQYQSATPDQQAAWDKAYSDALTAANDDPALVLPDTGGPVPVLLKQLLAQASSGSLDGALLSQGGFYQSDYTKPLLFLADGGYLSGRADAKHLSGDQWGMMNETGNYPGQAWLWLYTFWYQISPFNHSDNADALIWGLMAVLTLGFILIPFIPGVRSIPRYVPVYRLIWRDHYRRQLER
ncbi:MAG: hypothetical protein AUG49_01035 [Catenulispora sp. 13_1_20CM_3_70_7]|jgi:hypothetical protein|nr:MAG: hypothetical protein AUG49_01035 [Catenulispora sp. 13_1_20CM_3_70_7]